MDTQALTKDFLNTVQRSTRLYSRATKIKIPYEARKTEAVLYRGSLTEATRKVEIIADYMELPAWCEATPQWLEDLAIDAAAVIDGLIRLENVRTNQSDPRQTFSLNVSDLSEFHDGHPNLELFQIAKADGGTIIGYRFYFTAAAIKHEYTQ